MDLEQHEIGVGSTVEVVQTFTSAEKDFSPIMKGTRASVRRVDQDGDLLLYIGDNPLYIIGLSSQTVWMYREHLKYLRKIGIEEPCPVGAFWVMVVT